MSGEPYYKYSAFFSYSRADDKIAKALYSRLENFRTPRDMIGLGGHWGPVPAKLHPVFRDREDLSGGSALHRRLEIALQESKNLIVVCSPNSAKSIWVNHEVETFKALGRSGQIFPVIVSGEPGALNPNFECLAPALRDADLLAADLRDIKRPDGTTIGDGVEGGTLKLIAGLLGVELDQLRRRELRRLRVVAMRNAAIAVGALVLTGIAVVAGLGAFASALTAESRSNSAFAAESRFLAERARSALADGNEIAALRDARAGLPQSIASPDRPFFSSSETVLRGVLAQMRAYAQLPHDKQVAASLFISEGRALVTAERSGRVRLWRMADAVQTRTWEQLETGETAALVALSDGKFAVSTRDGRIAILDATSDTFQTIGAQGQDISALRAARSVLLALRNDGELIAIDWTRNLVLSKTTGVETLFSPVALTSNGATAFFVSKGDKESFNLLVAETSDLAGGRSISAHARVHALALSPDEKSVAVGDGFSISLVSADGRNSRKLSGHRGFIMSLAFTSDGRSLLSAGADGLGKVWSLEDGEAHSDFVGHEGLVNRVLTSERLAITYGGDLTVRLWTLDGTPRPTPIVLRGNRSRITDLATSNDSRWIATSSADATVVVWSRDNPSAQVLTPRVARHIFAWSRLFDRVLGVDNDNVVRWYETDTTSQTSPKVAVSLPEVPTTDRSSWVSWRSGGAFRNGARVAFMYNDVIYVGTPGSSMRPVSFPGRTVRSFALSRDAPAIVVVLDDGEALLSDQEASEWITIGDSVRFAALSNDGTFVILGRNTGASLIASRTQRMVREFPVTEPEGIVFSDKGANAVISSANQSLLVDLTQKAAPVTIAARSGFASGDPITLSSDGSRVAGSASDGTIWFWISGRGVATGKVEARRPSVTKLVFDDEADLAAAAYGDGVIRLWDIRSARIVARLEATGSSIVDMRLHGRTLEVLADDGKRTVFTLPPNCEELLTLAEAHLSRMQERSVTNASAASVQSFWSRFYLDRVRPVMLPLTPAVGEACGAKSPPKAN